MDALTQLEHFVRARIESGAYDAPLGRWQENYPHLSSVKEIASLIAVCRDLSADAQTKNRVLGILCLEASRGDEDAKDLVCWIMLPGLYSTDLSLAREVLESDEIHAEMLSGVWTGVSSVTPYTLDVARLLVRDARESLRRAVRQTLRWSRLAPILDEPHAGTLELESDADLDREDPETLLSHAISEGVISSLELELVTTPRCSARTAWGRWRLTPYSVQHRRQRAARKLLQWLQSRESTAASSILDLPG
jgi:hypothetical protein